MISGISKEAVDDIQHQVKRILDPTGSEWETTPEIAAALHGLQERGGAYIAAGMWEAAAGFYQAMIEGIVAESEHIDDPGGDVLTVLDSCLQALFICLENVLK